MMLMAAVCAATAHAEEPAVYPGQDLTRWQQLEQLDPAGDQAADAYRAYLLTYPESPLAEAAWGRLVALGADEGSWVRLPDVRQVVLRIRRSYELHALALAALDGSAPPPVGTIDLSPPATVVAAAPPVRVGDTVGNIRTLLKLERARAR